MHWQISTQTSTKYCFCVSGDKKIQCISSASKQQQFKDNESLWIYLKSKMSISVEEKNTGHLEGLENDSEKGPKRSVERTTRGVKLLLPIIITKYNRCHYSFLRQPRQQVPGGSGLAGGTPAAASPPVSWLRSVSRQNCVKVGAGQWPGDLWIPDVEKKVHEVLHLRRFSPPSGWKQLLATNDFLPTRMS